MVLDSRPDPTGEGVSGLWDKLKASFGFLPAVAMVAAVVLGFGLPAIDDLLALDLPVFAFDTQDPARSILEAIATVTVAVAGVAFSVTVVAFTLASSQLSPRVLRSFRADKLSQAALALFLGTAVYCLLVLVRLGALEDEGVPNLSISLAILLALASFGLFAVFVAHLVSMLQPSSLIAEIKNDGRAAIEDRYPTGVGDDPDDAAAAWTTAKERMRSQPRYDVRADGDGYVALVRGGQALQAAARRDALVRQVAKVGDYVVPGDVLAEVWREREVGDLTSEVAKCFALEKERAPLQDAAFPIRQLADVALKGLSPGINDPTTAENAMSAMAALLVRFATADEVSRLRVDGDGQPRFLAAAPDLNDLVRLGFDQVRVFAASYPVVAARLVELLERIRRAAASAGIDHAEAARQIALLREGAEEEVPTRADVERVRSGRSAG